MAGIFELTTAKDLYAKLKRDFSSFENAPLDSDVAFNFFVTAWHLLEWAYPRDSTTQKQIRDSNIVLQVCEHLAVGESEAIHKLNNSIKRDRCKHRPLMQSVNISTSKVEEFHHSPNFSVYCECQIKCGGFRPSCQI